jgi:hypothetical protein
VTLTSVSRSHTPWYLKDQLCKIWSPKYSFIAGLMWPHWNSKMPQKFWFYPKGVNSKKPFCDFFKKNCCSGLGKTVYWINNLMTDNCSLSIYPGLNEADLLNYQNWGSYSRFNKRVITPKLKNAITLLIFEQFRPNLGFG